MALLVLILYVSAVMGTRLFGEVAPDHFGSLGQSLWTLFQVMTGEAWPEVASAVMAERPTAWVFFLVFILVSSFVVLNLFLAVMVSAMESVRAQDEADGTAATPPGPTPPGPGPVGPAPPTNAALLDELTALRQEVVALRHLLEPEAPVPEQRS